MLFCQIIIQSMVILLSLSSCEITNNNIMTIVTFVSPGLHLCHSLKKNAGPKQMSFELLFIHWQFLATSFCSCTTDNASHKETHVEIYLYGLFFSLV